MGFIDFLTSLISLRSFSNIWYWIVFFLLIGRWIARPLGVPVRLLRRAKAGDEVALGEVVLLANLSIKHIANLIDTSLHWIAAAVAFTGTGLAILGWSYDLEIARAAMLIMLLSLVIGALTVARARTIYIGDLAPLDLLRQLDRHRRICELCSVIFAFAASLYGVIDLMLARVF